MKKYTEAQKRRALVKFARAYGKWNVIEKDDHKTRITRDLAFYNAGFKIIQKFGLMNDYFLAVGDCRGKRK